MFSGEIVASMAGLIDLDDRMSPALNRAHGNFNTFTDNIQRGGQRLATAGAGMAAAAAPVVGAFVVAVSSAVSFNEQMTNVGSILGRTESEMSGLSAQILDMGAAAREGPESVAEAYYDVVGGVADASTHMAILDRAIATSEAGAASLTGTTSALISAMNSYSFAAEDAGYASDVMTRTVQVGVGTMDDLGAALPQVAGLAASLGVPFDDLGASMAYLTTKGNSFSEAGTQMRSMMVALLNPNEKMAAALQEIGFSSGEAAIQQLGLVGAFEALADGSTTFNENMAGSVGSVEALNGVISLTGEGAAEALAGFTDGLAGATDAARALQLDSPAAAMDLLRAQISALSIEVGSVFLPVINDIVAAVRPIVTTIVEWVRENPELTAQVGLLAAGAVALGTAMSAAGFALMGVGAAVAFIMSPIGLAIAAAAALAAAYVTNFGGVRDFIDGTVRPALDQFFVLLGGVWEQVRPALEQLYNWFVVDALPAISDFITGPVTDAINGLIGILGGIWAVVRPALESLFGWFSENIPKIVEFVQGVIDKIGEMIEALSSWNGIMANQNTIMQGVNSGQWDIGQVLSATVNAVGMELRDSGGPGNAGQAYAIGTGAQPEVFVPESDGYFIPNADQVMGKTVNVYVTQPGGTIGNIAAARASGEEFGAAMAGQVRFSG